MIPINTFILYPTILIHGIGGDISDLNDMQESLESKGVETYNIEIGNGKIDSIFWNINKQCQVFSENINNLNLESKKINIIGISQGGLIARCYVEKYSNIKPVHSLITYATPHMGVYNSKINLKRLEYWKNPFNYQNFLLNNDFLVYINNDKKHVDTTLYRDNMISLDNFLIVWSDLENVVEPKESTKFEYFNISLANTDNKLEIVGLFESELYKKDYIGLKKLYENNKLIIKRVDCKHEEFKLPTCYLKKNLNNTTSLLDFTISLL
jgi:palmitoyl-protein thioesterase